MREITTRAYKEEDKEILDDFRLRYPIADLEVPHGFAGKGLETVISENSEGIVSSATGTLAIIIDPLISNPNASSADILDGLFKQEAIITYVAGLNNAVDSFVAIPKQLTKYIRLLEKCGYQRTAEHCVIMRRPLRPDTEPLIGPMRDKVIAESKTIANSENEIE